MRLWHNFPIFAAIAFASVSTAFTSAPLITAISNDDTAYLAPLDEGCSPRDRNCGNIEGKFLVSLREGYTRTSHLSYIAENLNIDPVEEWNIKWRGVEYYTATNVSAACIDILRQDPGIDEIEQSYWFSVPELDICTNPSLSGEDRKICYEEKDIPDCEKPSLSKEDRRGCFGRMKELSCLDPMLSADEKQSCQETYFLKPCENSKLSEKLQRFCRDGSLIATCKNLQFSNFDEGRRICHKSRASSVNT
jgi:hypothetical protein